MKPILVIIFGIVLMFTAAIYGCAADNKLSPFSTEQTSGPASSGRDTYIVQLTGSGTYLIVGIIALIFGVLGFFWLKSDRKAVKFERKSRELEQETRELKAKGLRKT